MLRMNVSTITNGDKLKIKREFQEISKTIKESRENYKNSLNRNS